MKNFAFTVANQDSGTGSWVLVHEVEEEEFVKGESWEFSDSLNFSNKVFVWVNIFGEELNTFKELVGDSELIEGIHEFL